MSLDNRPSGRRKSVSYAKWGYIFIIPFFLVYFIFTLVPQVLTIYNSFFTNYMDGLKHIGPEFVGLKNYVSLFTPNKQGSILILKYAANTMILWFLGAVPQFLIALLLAVFFTSYRLHIKGQGFFKTVIYMPNLIMASAFSMLFFTLFSKVGPVNQLLEQAGIMDKAFDFFASKVTVRGLIALMNFLMWFGNTTIVLMAGIMGIDQTLFEAATIDGANAVKVFFKVTMPLLMPIFVYCLITALIGGIQMFDVPQVLTNAKGQPNETTRTLVMYQNIYNTAFNYLKANGNRISGSISTTTKDYIINYQDLQGIGITGKLALPSLIALCSIALGRPTLGSLAVLGEISISGTMIKVDELANTLQCCLDSGAKKVLIPSVSMMDFATVPADLMGAFQLIPYSSAEDAVFKALGVD